MTNKMVIGALAEDLYRVAVGYHTGAIKMATMFSNEAVNRRAEIDMSHLSSHVQKLLQQLPHALEEENIPKKAENILMFSVILRNYAQSI